MFSNDYILYAIIVVVVFTLYMAIVHLLHSARANKRAQESVDSAYAEAEIAGDESAAPSALLQLCETLLPKSRNDAAIRKKISEKMALAGISSAHAVTCFLFCKRLVQPVVLLIGAVVSYNTITGGGDTSDKLLGLIVGLLLVIFGLKGAELYVANARQKRVKVLAHSFPDVMDLLLVCIEAGLGLDAAINRVCKELRDVHPQVIAELDRTRLELTMLGDRVVALQNLADRTNIPAFNTFVSALIQTEKFGTSLVDTLRVIAEDQRLTRINLAEQKAARIPVLITLPLILFIMPAFLMVIMGPPIIKVIEQGGIFGSESEALSR